MENLHKFKSFGSIKRKQDLSKDSQVLPFRIVYKTKLNPDGSLDKRKVRYALRGDIDKHKNLLSTYAGCIELPINLLNLSICSFFGKKPRIIDVQSAFLLADLKRVV